MCRGGGRGAEGGMGLRRGHEGGCGGGKGQEWLVGWAFVKGFFYLCGSLFKGYRLDGHYM